MSDLTPLMKQYNRIKKNYPDAILFFRLGDFYEMFGQDAITASKILQITLTSRDKDKTNPVPMCGIPYFTVETYISRLIRAGYKVAICEQLEDAKDAKGIVERDVIKVITPGTFAPDDPKENNYILCIFQKENLFGISVADITTGEFILYESSNNIADEISRFRPGEIVYPSSLKNNQAIVGSLKDYYLTSYDDWYFDYIEAYRKLLSHFRVSSLDGFGCEGMITAISSAGALLNYLEETQKGNIRFKRLRVLRTGSYMLIDSATQRNLEILRNIETGGKEGSLLWVMDETLTPMGGRLLRRWLTNPLLSIDDIRRRQSAVTSLVEGPELLSSVRELLNGISDIERLTSRISSGSANARDMLSLRDSLRLLPKLKEATTSDNEIINSISKRIDILTEVYTLIDNAIDDNAPVTLKEGGLIKKGFNKEVDELREMRGEGKDFIASLQERERKRTGISSLKVGYNRVFGYYIEVTKPNLPLVPDDYIRKQTLTGGERFITPELKDYEEKVLSAEGRLSELEYQIFTDIREEVSRYTERLQATAVAIAELDVYQALAYVAKRYNYVCPFVDDSKRIEIIEGRHPVLERMSLNERFIPNDTVIDDDNRILIITGPNMAGKSTYMRQVALIVLLAQIGGFVPAKEARIGIVDRIFTRIGASDIITKGQSTFMVEMLETANILNNATDKSLVVFDEVGRGTSTFDGISIAWAVVEYIVKRLKARTLFATHYHELTELSLCLEGVKNLNVAVKEWDDEVIFLRKVVDGPADKSYGIQVARLAGLPDETIIRAKEVLANLEKSELNEIGTPRLAYSHHGIKRQGQLDLFTTQADPVIKEILGLDVMNMTPIEAMNKLYEIRKKLSENKRNN